MPIYEITCQDCGKSGETLVLSSRDDLVCPTCGSTRTTKMMSAPSDYGSQDTHSLPGPTDTACCGSSPAASGCVGLGSCCGKRH